MTSVQSHPQQLNGNKMNVKGIIKTIVLILIMIQLGWAQDFKTHKVKPGETIESIASNYMVTPFDILALNPDAKQDLRPEMVLVIPKSRVAENPTVSEEQRVTSFKTHKVKRKETLFSISRRYKVSVDDIKRHNKRLYSENLRKGDRIQIPQFSTVQVTNTLENTIRLYEVQPKEGKWRIAYKFGISIDELEALNPGMGENLQIGQLINVPNIADNEIRSINDDEYGYYTVLPKEGFYRLKLKLGLEQEQLEALNPELKETGLKAGMILKVPKDVGSDSSMVSVAYSSLLNNLNNFSPKKLAVMLPFRLHRVDLDSVPEAKEMLEKDRYLSISLDFHSGVLVALDSAKQLGISTALDVYDTKARISEVSRLISSNDFSEYDAVIGPFTSDNFDRAAEALRRDDVPIFAAVTAPKKLYSNVYQTIPSDEYLRKKILAYVKQDSLPKTVLVIADSRHKAVSDAIKQELPDAVQIFSRRNKDGKDANYVLIDDVEGQLKPGRNIVFLETQNEGFVSNVTSMLSAFINNERKIILMTTNRNRAFESLNVSNYDLSSLQFHYPSVNRSMASGRSNGFVKRYEAEYGTEPNRYAVRGFDLTMDILLRLASAEKLEDASTSDIETEYVENKFRYAKKMFGGHYNESAYLVKFENLQIVEIKQ